MSASDTPSAADVAELIRRLAEVERRAESAEARVAELTRALAAQAPSAPAVPAPSQAAVPVAAVAKPEPEPAPAATAEAAPAAQAPAEGELTELQKTIIEQRRKLAKRGFHREDRYYYQCAACQEHAVEKWGLFGRPGGRDIDLCLACGSAWSWRRRPDFEQREPDTTFDLATFLR